MIKQNLEKIPLNSLLVLKDNAYGCDMKRVLDIAYKLGFRFFCVLKPFDASYIVSSYLDTKVLILGKEKMASLSKRIFLTVENEDDYQFCRHYNMPFHFKLKSKMNRFGLDLNPKMIEDDLCSGIYAHVGYYNKNKINEELKAFSKITKNINHKLIHIGGSHLKEYSKKIPLRVGMSIYDNAVEIKGKIVKCFMLRKNEAIGYNDSYIAKKDIKVGIVDVGYNSGLTSYLHHWVYIKGDFYQMIGTKCMDFSFIQINDKIKEGDEVELLGPHLRIDSLEKKENKSRYELYVNLK